MKKNIGQIAQKLKSCLSEERLTEMASQSNFVERFRQIHPAPLVLSLLRCFSTHNAHDIAGLYRSFVNDVHSKVAYSSFYDQLSKETCPIFIMEIYRQMGRQLYMDQRDKIPSVFEKFDDVLLQDGTSWGINQLLSEVFPGRFTKTSPAAIEMHTLYSLKKATYHGVAVAPDSQSEHDYIPDPTWLACFNKLFLLDAGYVNIPKLEKLGCAGGFYIVKAKVNCNPVIEEINSGSSWHQKKRVGKKLRARPLKRGKDYDFQVRMLASDRKIYPLRLVALWNPQSKEHVFFLTNLPPERVTFKDIGSLYRLRWQVELSYKELKSYTALKRFLTANDQMIVAFAFLSLIAMQLRRYLVFSAESLNPRVRLSFHKAAISASEFMPKFIACLLKGGEGLKDVLLEIFFYLGVVMKFSNPQRPSAFELCQLERKEKSALCQPLAA